MLRYKGVLHMKGTDRKVIFQGVHQLMGSDLGPAWAAGEKRNSKMVFIGIDLPQGYLPAGAGAVPRLSVSSRLVERAGPMSVYDSARPPLARPVLRAGRNPRSPSRQSGYNSLMTERPS